MARIIRDGQKVYIPGVRKISWDTGEMCEYASALVSALGSLGDAVAYPFVMGACGAAFRFAITPGAWNPGEYSIRGFTADPMEPVGRSVAAAGYACEVFGKGDKAEDTARILRSIDQGRPALAFGVVGPSDCCVLSGYDEAGEVLLGWSTYQNIPDDHPYPPDPTGYFRKPGWHDALGGYVLLGEKTGRPPAREFYLGALRWAVQLARGPRVGSVVTGLAGLSAWAAELAAEENFPAQDEGTMGWRYLCTTLNITQLRDHVSAAAFLRRAGEEVPELLPEAELAAACYQDVERLRERQDALFKDDFSPPALQAFAAPAARQEFARLILEIRDREEEGIRRIEGLLGRLEGNSGN